jgi:hypothetical protein
MESTKVELPLDDRVGQFDRPLRKVEVLWRRISQKQREIRLLELELDRTDPNEPAEETDSEVKK